MNTRFPGCLVGTTTTTSGTISLDAAALPFGAKLDDYLVNGATYAFYVRWPDNTTTGFLEGFGVWSSTGNGSITRAKITNSTVGEATDYTFAAGTKHILIVTPGSELANMASVFLDLPPWQDIVLGGMGQSNFGWSNLYLTGSAPASNSMVLDWCKPAAGGTAAWRVTDPTEHDTNLPVDDTVYVGTPRMAESASVWYPTGHIGRSLALTLQAITGRKVRTIFAATVGTPIDSGTKGWWPYNTALSTGCAKMFKDAVVAALAQMTTDDPRQTATKLHGFLWAQGESDVNATPGTAANATTNAAGYAVGATTLTLASAGTGTIVAGDILTFADDTNAYLVATGDTDVSNGGTIVLAAPGLRIAMSAATKTITLATTIAKSSARYGFMLYDVIAAMEDTTRWGICDSNTTYLLYDLPPYVRNNTANGRKFMGHAIAKALIGDRARIVSTEGMLGNDGAHYTGANADTLGGRGAKGWLSPSRAAAAATPAFMLRKDATASATQGGWTRVADGTGGLSAGGKYKFTSGNAYVQITFNDNSGLFMFDAGLKHIPTGTMLKFEKVTAPAGYRTCITTGPVEDNASYYRIPIGTIVDTGTIPAVADATYITTPLDHLWDGTTMTAATDLNILSAKLATGQEIAFSTSTTRTDKLVGADTEGKLRRSNTLIPMYYAVKTTSNAGYTLFNNYLMADGDAEHIDATVGYKCLTSNKQGAYRIQAIARRSGSSVLFDTTPTITQVQDGEALGVSPVIASDNFFSILWGWKITHTGKAATTLHWTTEVRVIPLATSA
jgi:hypothetical protein